MARFQIHEHAKVGELSDSQITSLTSFLSTPSLVVNPMTKAAENPQTLGLAGSGSHGRIQLSDPSWVWKGDEGWLGEKLRAEAAKRPDPWVSSTRQDPLAALLLENEGRRAVKENIAHHRNVGSYIGRRHAMALPVRGQRTQTNAKTARKMNRIDRRG